jgi:hypothetical protein
MTNRHEKILKVLANGQNITAAQLEKKSGVSGITQRIAELRRAGYPNIYTNVAKRNGRAVNFYRLGNPTKKMKTAARKGKLALATA